MMLFLALASLVRDAYHWLMSKIATSSSRRITRLVTPKGVTAAIDPTIPLETIAALKAQVDQRIAQRRRARRLNPDADHAPI